MKILVTKSSREARIDAKILRLRRKRLAAKGRGGYVFDTIKIGADAFHNIPPLADGKKRQKQLRWFLNHWTEELRVFSAVAVMRDNTAYETFRRRDTPHVCLSPNGHGKAWITLDFGNVFQDAVVERVIVLGPEYECLAVDAQQWELTTEDRFTVSYEMETTDASESVRE